MALAVITGASSGMGACYAQMLAEQGYDLLLTGRDQARLAAVASRLPVTVTPVVVELTDRDARLAFYQQYDALLSQADLLIANAGVGFRQPLQALSEDEVFATAELNMVALTELVHRVGQSMCQRGHGQVLLVSSIVAWLPVAQYSLYSASKAYVLALGESLHFAWRRLGVKVTTSCPSTTKTAFFERSGQTLSRLQQRQAMSVEAVCQQALTDLCRGKRVSVPGRWNRVLARLLRCLPAGVIRRFG